MNDFSRLTSCVVLCIILCIVLCIIELVSHFHSHLIKNQIQLILKKLRIMADQQKDNNKDEIIERLDKLESTMLRLETVMTKLHDAIVAKFMETEISKLCAIQNCSIYISWALMNFQLNFSRVML